MKIKSLEVEGLSGRISEKYVFHEDINIITGLNGSGKTTLLKLVWYLISGNIERIAPEMEFKKILLETDLYKMALFDDDGVVTWEYTDKVGNKTAGNYNVANDYRSRNGSEILNQIVMKLMSNSLYFPTFRRIEGGYSLSGHGEHDRGEDIHRYAEHREIQHGMESVSDRLSVRDHQFVCSISTNDIILLLTKKYAAISENLNSEYKEFSTSIIEIIRGAKLKTETDIEISALTILNDLQDRADKINDQRKQLLNPFSVLSELTEKLFSHRGIKVSGVTLGESVNAIDSSALSAGEKQMLSFLCYNAFKSNSVVFIDEPELSLHPDWQRRLFPILMKQQPSNQFIIATHSPFIYSKYDDKEILMGDERGE